MEGGPIPFSSTWQYQGLRSDLLVGVLTVASPARFVFVIAILLPWAAILSLREVASEEAALATSREPRSIGSWPNWMGPNHDGVSDETGWSAHWPEQRLTEVWSREIGIGFSSISISNGRLYTMGYSEKSESVFCLDLVNGQELWSHTYPCKLIDNLYEGGPGATPTIDGDRVYTLGKEGQLFCLDAIDGSVVWEKDLQKDLAVELPEWGFNCSPTMLDNQVLIAGGRVVSYQKTTGAKKWQSDEHTAGYGGVRPIQSKGDTLLAVLDCDALRILRNRDGSQVDSYPWKSPFQTNSTTPIVHHDTIFVSTGYQVGCGLFRLIDKKLERVYENSTLR